MEDLDLYQRLDGALTSMADSFCNLLKASRIAEEDQETSKGKQAPGDLLEVLSERLVHSGHVCIHLITELKKGAMLSDFESITTNVRQVKSKLDDYSNKVDNQLRTMRQEVTTLLNRLEEHYYCSSYKGDLPPGGLSSELLGLCNTALQDTA